MAQVRIITERIGSLSYKFSKEIGITTFPVNIIQGDKTIKDDNDDIAKQFLQSLPSQKDIPSTAVPSHGEMLEIFRQATKDFNQAIYIAASSKLSSIYDRGKKVAEDLKKEGKDIRVFDSYGAVSMEGMYAYEANLMSKEGKSIDEILDALEETKSKKLIVEYGVIETLKYLEKNGRIGKAQAWLGSLFSFKPLISTKEGVLEPIGKVRTNDQGLDKIVSIIKEEMSRTKSSKIKVMYDYGLDEEYVRNIVDKRIQDEFDAKVISLNQVSTAIACHIGPELWGVCIKLES